jgi:hypothetical protein
MKHDVYTLEHVKPFNFLHLRGGWSTRDIELDTTHIRFP